MEENLLGVNGKYASDTPTLGRVFLIVYVESLKMYV